VAGVLEDRGGDPGFELTVQVTPLVWLDGHICPVWYGIRETD
jgi:hypothetical protein